MNVVDDAAFSKCETRAETRIDGLRRGGGGLLTASDDEGSGMLWNE